MEEEIPSVNYVLFIEWHDTIEQKKPNSALSMSKDGMRRHVLYIYIYIYTYSLFFFQHETLSFLLNRNIH